MKCITNPTINTYLIIDNDGSYTTAFATPGQQVCTKETNTIEEFTNENDYVQRCEELGIEPDLPPSLEE